MRSNFKNTLASLLISTAIIACGGDKDSGNTSSFDGPALTNQSITNGSIRPEVGTLTKETLSKLMSELDDAKGIELVQNTLDKMEELLTTSQNQPERDFLQMHINLFSKMSVILKTTAKDQRSEAGYRIFLSLKEQQSLFFRKYIQSPQLHSLFLQKQALDLEKAKLENHPEKVEERDANVAKAIELDKKVLALYDDPNLDAQTKAEFEALDELGFLTTNDIQNIRKSVKSQTESLSAQTLPPSALSIGVGSIRPAVKKALKDAYLSARVRKYIIDPVEHQKYKEQKIATLRNNLGELQQLASTKQSDIEAKILNKAIAALEDLVNVNSITYASEEAESTAIEKVVDRYRESLAQTILQNIQSPKLKEYFTKIYQMKSDRRSDSPIYTEAKAREVVKEFLAFYSSSSLDGVTRSEIQALDDLGFLTAEDIQNMKRFAYSKPEPLSASTPDLSEKASLRRARQDGAEVDFSQLMMNGVAGGYAPLSLPVYVQLKGSIEGSKDTRDLTGVAVCKFDHMLVGVIHGYANASKNSDSTLNHNETSAVISRSFGNAYLEGQAGFIHSTINQQDISGERYQLSAGYDFEYLTPFVQASTRNLNAVNEHSVQAGCEVDVLNLVTDQYKLSTRMTLKGGYHSFKGAVGSVEGSGAIQLNDGLKLDAALNLAGREESSARIGFSIDQ